MTFGLSGAAFGGLVAGVGTLGGALIGANAAGNAADTQAGSADRANQLAKDTADKQLAFQKDAMDKQIALQKPFRDIGLAGQNKLAFLLGLTDTGADSTDMNIQRLRSQLGGRFTTHPDAGTTVLDDLGLSNAVRAELTKQGQFGSLAKDFGEAPPTATSITQADLEADPSYAFKFGEGQKAVERGAAAHGGLFSGRAAKDLTRFGQGLASTEFGNVYGRRVGEWQNRLNLFQTNRANALNPLQSIGGVGQTATGQMGAAVGGYGTGASNTVGNYGQTAGGNIIGAGNAQAAGQVGQANAFGNAISQGSSMYMQNQLMNKLFERNNGIGANPYDSWQTAGNGMPPGY